MCAHVLLLCVCVPPCVPLCLHDYFNTDARTHTHAHTHTHTHRVMGATQKGGFQRRGRSAAREPVLLIVSLISLFLTAHGAECGPGSGLPCTFGPCTFFTDASGVLDRTGSCPDQGAGARGQGPTPGLNLLLSGKGIKALKDGVFNNMAACFHIDLGGNELSNLPETIFRGLTNLETLALHDNKLSSLPETIFQGLTSLRLLCLSSNSLTHLPGAIWRGNTKLSHLFLGSNKLSYLPETIFIGTSILSLDLSGNELSHLPETIFNGLILGHLSLNCDPAQRWRCQKCGRAQCAESDFTDNLFTCVPLTQARIAGLREYRGPSSTCEYSNCTAGNAGPIGSTCMPCGAGKYSPISGVTACVDCRAGKFQTTAGVTIVCVQGRVKGGRGLGKKESKAEGHIHTCISMHAMTTLPMLSSRHNTVDRMTMCACVCE